jgi:hypothetical protein
VRSLTQWCESFWTFVGLIGYFCNYE